jgi:hypothetical protein
LSCRIESMFQTLSQSTIMWSMQKKSFANCYHIFIRPTSFYLHFIHSFINGSTALCCALPLQFRNLFYQDDWTPHATDQPIARPLPTYRTTQTQDKYIHRHPCLECNLNTRSQHSSERIQFMSQTERSLWTAMLPPLPTSNVGHYTYNS